MNHEEYKAQVADSIKQNVDEIREYQRERRDIQDQVDDMASLVERLRRDKETALLESAEALLAGEPFDLSVFRDLDDRLAQAGRAILILRQRLVAFEKRGQVFDAQSSVGSPAVSVLALRTPHCPQG